MVTLALLLQVALAGGAGQGLDTFTNDFVVEIDGDASIADLVAGTHGCRIKRDVSCSLLLQVQVL